MNAKPMPAGKVLDATFLEARARLLDLAAILDRIERGGEFNALESDTRMQRIRQALKVLSTAGTDRAEQIQNVFSLTYDPTWPKPQPRV